MVCLMVKMDLEKAGVVLIISAIITDNDHQNTGIK